MILTRRLHDNVARSLLRIRNLCTTDGKDMTAAEEAARLIIDSHDVPRGNVSAARATLTFRTFLCHNSMCGLFIGALRFRACNVSLQ